MKNIRKKWTTFYEGLSLNTMAVVIAVLGVLIVASLVLLGVVLSSDAPPATTDTTAPATTPPGVTTSAPAFWIYPDETVKVEASEDGRTFTLYVSEGTETLSLFPLVKAKESYSVADSENKACPDGILKITEDGTYFTIVYGSTMEIYRLVIRYQERYRLTFEGLDVSVWVEKGKTAVATDQIPQKTGYRFLRWDFDFTKPITADTTVTALWEANRYTVTLNADGGTVDPSDVQVLYGAKAELPTPVKAGFRFIGWLYNGESVSLEPWSYAENVTLTASWTLGDYVITYDAAGGYVDKSKQGVTYGDAFTTPIPSRTGYTFVGWYVGETRVNTQAYTYSTDMTFSAKWLENRYTVHYVTNGGDPISSETLLFTEIGMAVPRREGYTFGSWYTNAAMTTQTVLPNESGEVTLYAWWREEHKTSEFSFQLSDTEATITAFKGRCTICLPPAYIGGKPVTAIGEGAFENSTTLRHIALPSSVVTIGARAFAGCSQLSKFNPVENTSDPYPINLAGFSVIGEAAFRGCAFEEVRFPVGMTAVPNELFAECEKLKTVVFEDVTSLGNGVFRACTSLNTLTLPQTVTTLGEELFRDCTALSSLTLHDGITAIGKGAFRGCTALGTLVLPKSLSVIADELFAGCTALQTLGNFADNPAISSIGAYAFADCARLDGLVVGERVTELGAYAFRNCSLLKTVTLPAAIRHLNDGVFEGCVNLTSVTVQGALETIGKNTFADCRSLGAFYPGASLRSIGEGAFSDAASLSVCPLPSTLTSLGQNAFYGCSRLKEVQLSEALTVIPNGAFYGCYALSSLTLPSGVTRIGDKAFYGCSSLTLSTWPVGIRSVGAEAFASCTSLQALSFDVFVETIGARAFADCTALVSVTFKGSSERFKGVSASDAFEGCTALAAITTASYAEDLAPFLTADPVTAARWSIDNTLSMNDRRPAAVLAFADSDSIFYRNLIAVDSAVTDPALCASLASGYVWKLTVADQLVTVTQSAVYHTSNGAYVYLDLGEDFIPAAGIASYRATLAIYDEEKGTLLYTADLGSCIFRNVMPSLSEDTARSETTPLTGYTVAGPDVGLTYGVEKLFDGMTDTVFFADTSEAVTVTFSSPHTLTSFSLITAPTQASYYGALPTGVTLFGEVMTEDGLMQFQELAFVETVLEEKNLVEYNIKVTQDTPCTRYKLLWDNQGIVRLAEIVLYGNAS